MTLARGRFYLLPYLPHDLTPKPLLVAPHGYNGTATNVQGVTGLDPWSNARGDSVAYPQGIDGAWNAGNRLTPTAAVAAVCRRTTSATCDVVATIAAKTPTTTVSLWASATAP